MSQNTKKKSPGISLALARLPVLWGALASIAFYAAIRAELIQHEIISRYFASHPVEYIATTMFFVGMAALIIKFLGLLGQPSTTNGSILGTENETNLPAEAATTLLDRLGGLSSSIRNSLLGRRLRDALTYIERRGTADDCEDQLRHLADNEAGRSHSSYSLVRILISTIPILGFLGTVIGLTRAVAELASVIGEVSFDEAINSVVAGLSVAFDTTALSLALSIVLMFAMFFVNRRETQLLNSVEDLAEKELGGCFAINVATNDPNVAVIRQMCDQVMAGNERLTVRQAEIWQRSMESAHQRWSTMAVTSEKQLETALSRALKTSYETHTKQLQESAEVVGERAAKFWDRSLNTLESTTQQLTEQQSELRRQGEVMLQVVDATGRVTKLEDALNRNLGTLSEAHSFEQAVTTLAAAINLFSTKVGGVSSNVPGVHLKSDDDQGQAA